MTTHSPHILIIATFPPPIHGSAVVSEQIKNSRIINDVFKGDYVNLGTSRRMDEIGKGGLRLTLKKLVRFTVAFFKTFGLLLTHRYDLCYCAITCHGTGFLKDAPFVLLCKLFRRNIVIHQHNKGMSKDVDKPVYRWLLPMVYKNAKVILLSWHLYPDIAKVVKRDDVMICFNGIKPSSNLGFEQIQNKTPHILFLSNLLTDKGVLVLLDSLKILKEKSCSFVCDFVGSETMEIDVARFSKEVEVRGLNRFAVYHGCKYGKEKDSFWKEANIFVFPTFYHNECFPLVNLEAMEYALPVISTNEGGIPDIVVDGETGYIVEKNNPKALADALEILLKNPELRIKMGKAGRKRFEELFTEEIFESRMRDCLSLSMK